MKRAFLKRSLGKKKKKRKKAFFRRETLVRKKHDFWKKNYTLSFRYIKECRNHILFIILVFLFSALVALYYQPVFIVNVIKDMIKNLLEETFGLNMWQMIVFILNNNLKSSFFGMLLGIFLGISPIFVSIVNGYILGFIAEKSVGIEGFSVLWRLLPHGIFELPAVLLSLALGTKLGTFLFSAKNKMRAFFYYVVSLTFFVLIFIILLFFIFLVIVLTNGIGNIENIAQLKNLMNSRGFSVIFLILFLISIYIGMFVLSKEDKKLFLEKLEQSLRVFLFIVLPLLIIAAIIEGVLIFVLPAG